MSLAHVLQTIVPQFRVLDHPTPAPLPSIDELVPGDIFAAIDTRLYRPQVQWYLVLHVDGDYMLIDEEDTDGTPRGESWVYAGHLHIVEVL